MCAANSRIGNRVKLIGSSRPSIPVKPGDTGVIWRVTQIGTVRVIWDNGISFDLNSKTDHWEVLVNGAHTGDSEHKAEKRLYRDTTAKGVKRQRGGFSLLD